MVTNADHTRLELNQIRRLCRNCFLKNLCLPAGLNEEQIQELEVKVQSQQRFDGDEYIYRMGEPSKAIYVLRSGSAKSYLLGGEGEIQIVGLHLPGELLGLDALQNPVHALTVQALEPTSVCALPLDELDRVMEELPAINRQIMKLVAQDLSDASETHTILARTSALERVSLFLKRYSERLQRRQQRGDHFRLSVSRQDLANYLGLKIETVSRMFSRLRDEGIIEVDRRLIAIIDPVALDLAAGNHLSCN